MKYFKFIFLMVSIIPLASCGDGTHEAGKSNPDKNFKISLDASQLTDAEESYLKVRLDRAIRPLNAIKDLFPPEKFTTVIVEVSDSCPQTVDNAKITTDQGTGKTKISLCSSVREALISNLYSTGLEQSVKDSIRKGDNAFVTYFYHYIGHYLFDTYSLFEKFGTETDSEDEMREEFANKFSVYTSLQDFGGNLQAYLYSHLHAKVGFDGSSFGAHLNSLPGIDRCLLHGGDPSLQETLTYDSIYRNYGVPTPSQSALDEEQNLSAEYGTCREKAEETMLELVTQAPRITNTPWETSPIEGEGGTYFAYDYAYDDVELALAGITFWQKPIVPVPDWPETQVQWRDTIYNLDNYTGLSYDLDFAILNVTGSNTVSVVPQWDGSGTDYKCEAIPNTSMLDRASDMNLWRLTTPVQVDCYFYYPPEIGLDPQLASSIKLESIEFLTTYPEIAIMGPEGNQGVTWSPVGFWCVGGPCQRPR